MTRSAAFLRGINVGGHNKISMAHLRAMMEQLGHTNVETYIQSGNVAFTPRARADNIHLEIAAIIQQELELSIPVVIRTHAQLLTLHKRVPFPTTDGKRLHVVFLSETPTQAAIDRLDPKRSPLDLFAVDGAEIFVQYGTGAGQSKLTLDFFERLGTTATARNWNTVERLLALTAT